MSNNWWDVDPEAEPQRQKVKHPTTPEDFPFESVKRAGYAKSRADELATKEAGGDYGDGPVGPVAATGADDWMSQDRVVDSAVEDNWMGEDQEVTNLMSLRGAGSLLRQIGPRIARGILGMQLRELEAIELSRTKGKPQIGPDGNVALPAHILEKRRAIEEADAELQKILGAPSGPLSIAQDVVGSIAENAPGLLAATTSRNLGPVAAAPALNMAYESASGHAYAGFRTGKDPKDIEQSQIAAHGAGVSEVVWELTPMSYLLKNLGKEGVVQLVKGYLIRELGTELGTTATNKITEWSTVEQDKPVGEFLAELKDELVHTGLVTVFAAPLTGAGAHISMRAGRLGRQRDDEPTELPGREDPIAEQADTTNFGAESSVQSAPKADLVTNPLDSQTQIALEAQAAAIKPEEIDGKQLEDSARVFAEIKGKEKAPVLPGAEEAWSQVANAPSTAVEDAGELGASQRQADNAPNYINPNQGQRLDRKIAYGPAAAIGMTPRQVTPEATTYVLGEDTDDRPGEFMAPLRETVEGLRQKYLPNSTIVLSNEQLFSNSALGWHYTTGLNKHMIVPAVLRKPSRGWAQFNPNTIASAFYNMTHEFGHAIVADRLYEGAANDEAVGRVRDESRQGLVSQEAMAGLPNAPVIAEFNALKKRILDDAMTAEEFVQEWMGPAKIGRKTFLKELKVSPKAPAKQLVNAIADRAVQNSNIDKDTSKAALKQRLVEDILSLDEYGAEQVSRFAYQKKWDQSTPLGKFFGETLRIMRQFFTDAKKDGLISAGTAFSEWMEGLGKTPRPLEERARTAEARKKQTRKVKVAPAAKPAAKPKKKKAAKPVERVQHNVESDTHKTKEQQARGIVVSLVRSNVIKREDMEYGELMSYIALGDFEQFAEVYTNITKKTVSFDPPASSTTFTPSLPKSNFKPEQNLFNTPSLKSNTKVAWRSMGAGEFNKLISGEKTYTGEKAASKGNFLAGIPESAAQFGGKGRYLVEFSNIKIAGNEGLVPGSVATRENISNIWKHDGTTWKEIKTSKINLELDVTQEDDWDGGKFDSPGFKAFFGDWVRDPVGSSKIRVGAFRQKAGIISVDNELVAPPLVLFASAERLKQGLNAFHASTPRGQQYVESRSMDAPDDATLVPVVLNIRNPFIQGDLSDPAPSREDLLAQGHDGIVYQNDFDGDLSFIVFRPQQIKVVSDRSPYSNQKGFHLELDHDQSTPEGHGAAKLMKTLRSYLNDPGQLNRALKHFNQGMRFGMQMQQISQKHPDVVDADFFVRTNTEYTSYKSNRLSIPDKVLDFWEDMPNGDFEKISSFLKAQVEGGQRWFTLAETNKIVSGRSMPWYELQVSEATLQKAKEHGIDVDTPRGKELLNHLRNVENSLLDSLNEDERIISLLLQLRYGHNQLYFMSSIIQLKHQIHAMRQKPFLPRKWFGRYLVTMSEKVTTGYEVIHKEAFDYAWQRDAVHDKLNARKKPNQIVQATELTDTEFVMMGLPKDFLDTVGSELGLEQEQINKLSEILQPVKQEKLLKDRDLKAMGITGASQDIMRSYADYTWHHSNLQAKMLYRKQFNMAIGKLRQEVEELSYTGSPDYYRQYGILKAMEGARDYIMHPPNEWHAARAAVSLGYLAGNLKTAVANSFGLALTWTDLTARHGSHNGEMRFYQAVYRNSASVWAKETLPKEIQEGLARAQEEGVLDQTYAYHVAGAANANRMWRALSRRRAIRYFQKAVDGAMFPFRLMELFTRRVTFLASLQENLDRKQGFNEAYKAAVQKTNNLQNDYTAGNRIPLMRGKMAMVTIFMSFAQHAGFHSLGQYEAGQRALIRHQIDKKQRPESDRPTKIQLLHGHTARLWALLFFLAGAEGLPFAENLLDIAEWIWRRYGKKPIRQELRELVQSMEQDPHLWMRGLSHNVAGFDISRSVGFGRLFPGTEILARTQKHNFDEHVGSAAVDLAGVTGHTAKWIYEMTASDKPVSEAMKGAPGLAGNLWNAYDWSKHGVRGPNGGLITRDKDGNVRDLTAAEIVGKMAGFNPEIVSRNREINFETYSQEVYWTTRRSHLKREIWKGVMQGDRELEAEAREAIKEFNEFIGNEEPWRKLRIDNAEIARYIQAKKKRQRLEENQQPTNKRFGGLHKDLRKSYEAPDEEGNL